MPKKGSITIVLVDDHRLVRQGLAMLLGTVSDLELVGEAGDGLEALQLVEELKPDLLLLDLMIPRVHGLEVARRVRHGFPETRVIILSMHNEDAYVVEALRNGVSGYVLKNSSGTDLIEAIRKVHQGQRYLSPWLSELALKLLEKKSTDPAKDIYDLLTSRERVVLELAAKGHSSAEIGKRLFISQRTAETHRANLMRKLGLRSQTDLVRFAIRKGIIPP